MTSFNGLDRWPKATWLAVAIAIGAVAGCGANTDNDIAPTPSFTYQEQKPSVSQTPITPETSVDSIDHLRQTAFPELEQYPVWYQDFSAMPDGPVSSSDWYFETNPAVPTWNEEQQVYTNSERNVFIKDGSLVIRAIREDARYDNGESYPFSSGRIDTRNSFSFSRGMVVSRMKLPVGQGVWPAFWLLSQNQVFTNEIPNLDWEAERTYMIDGEIDIVEAYGDNMIEASFHTFLKSHEASMHVDDLSNQYHDYGIIINDNQITWTFDGQPYYEVIKPSDDPNAWPIGKNDKGKENLFYIILNLAMGGSGGGPISTSLQGAEIDVASVAYYAPEGNGSGQSYFKAGPQ